MSERDFPSIQFVRQCLTERDGYLFWLTRPLEHFATERAWKIWNTKFSGKEAGTLGAVDRAPGKPRWFIVIGRHRFFRYTIVWAFHKGEWRLGLDHIDRNQLNDRIENLRPATPSQNVANGTISRCNTSGRKGVSWYKRDRKWDASIRVNGRLIYLGRFTDPDEAHAAYLEAAKKHFGEFACSG